MAGIRACEQDLREHPRHWLVTGVAGFIGSNLLERLLRLNQKVIGIDNLSTGHVRNLDVVRTQVTSQQWQRFHYLEGDIRDLALCRESVKGVDYVLHQAALGSVPRSLLDPIDTHENNLTGFLNMLMAAREMQVRRFVYASSSSVYGDHAGLPKVEEQMGTPLSPYAVTKCANELYATVFARCYDMQVIGLRYFNVFGPRQDPEGAYAAVIPLWFTALLRNKPVYINGDGETSRDFCYVDNAVQANLLAAWVSSPEAINQAYNVAVGDRTTLLQLFELIKAEVSTLQAGAKNAVPQFREFRPGDIRHSLADISKVRQRLGYEPQQRVAEGLKASAPYYLELIKQGLVAD